MKTLIFEDLETGKIWRHSANDWILNYCNFDTHPHPNQLRLGQSIIVKDVDGHRVRISAIKEASHENS
jgi:hypothetical protein